MQLITDDPNLPENGWQLVSKQKEGMCVEAYKKKIPEFATDINFVTGIMKGLDFNKTFELFCDIKSEAWQSGMLDNIEWVDEAAKIFRMVVSIPLFSKRDVVAQLKVDSGKKVIMMKSVKSEKCPEVSGVIRAQMTDCFRLEE